MTISRSAPTTAGTAKELHPHDLEAVQAILLAGLRASSAELLDDPRLTGLVDELSGPARTSGACGFATTPGPSAPGRAQLEHPEVGRPELTYHRFDVASGDGQELCVYHAEPGSRSARSPSLLASLPDRRLAGAAASAEP